MGGVSEMRGPYYKGSYYLGVYVGSPIFVNPVWVFGGLGRVKGSEQVLLVFPCGPFIFRIQELPKLWALFHPKP